MKARESSVFHNNSYWVKENGDKLFDVTVGSYGGAEIAELICLKGNKRSLNRFIDGRLPGSSS